MIMDDVKLNLRISHGSMDNEVLDLIESAKMQMGISGIKVISEIDALTKRAIILYCKANFGLDNKDSEKYQLRFDSLITHMSMCPEYNTAVVI